MAISAFSVAADHASLNLGNSGNDNVLTGEVDTAAVTCDERDRHVTDVIAYTLRQARFSNHCDYHGCLDGGPTWKCCPVPLPHMRKLLSDRNGPIADF